MRIRKILSLSVLAALSLSWAYAKPDITFYFSPHCTHCFKVKEDIIPALQKRFSGMFTLQMKNTTQHDVLQEFTSLCAHFHVDAYVPAFYVRFSPEETYLFVGADNIENNIFRLLSGRRDVSTSRDSPGSVAENRPQDPEKAAAQERLTHTFSTFSLGAVAGAGLIDGINPCAFAVIILFISFLSVYGYSRPQIIVIGSFYILAVFLAYLLIGLGVFNFLYTLNVYYTINRVFYGVIILLCLFLGGFSLYDYYIYRKSGATSGMFLQLPAPIKRKIQLILSAEYRKSTKAHSLKLAIGAFVVGGMVSILEAVCTGQIYVPVIAVIVKNSAYRLKALGFLILYNFMFVLPLITLLLLSLCGVGPTRLNSFLKSHLGALKILLAFLFFGLGLFIFITAF